MRSKKTLHPHEFWNWFCENSGALASNPQSPALLREIDDRIRALNSRLSWEIGPGLSKPWQLVISPDLNRGLREIARSIVSQAPVLDAWEFHSARQPKDWDYKFELEAVEGKKPIKVDASTWAFVLLEYPDGSREILLKGRNLPVLTDAQQQQAAEIVLESILGEDTFLNAVDDFELVNQLEPRFAKKQRRIQQLREAVLGGPRAN
jgi:hypothetical protein